MSQIARIQRLLSVPQSLFDAGRSSPATLVEALIVLGNPERAEFSISQTDTF